MRGKMTVAEAMALLRCADPDLLTTAGPAVLRLQLLEITHLAQSRRANRDIREAARLAAIELRQLIAERPCASLVDRAAQLDVARAEPSRKALVAAMAGHA